MCVMERKRKRNEEGKFRSVHGVEKMGREREICEGEREIRESKKL